VRTPRIISYNLKDHGRSPTAVREGQHQLLRSGHPDIVVTGTFGGPAPAGWPAGPVARRVAPPGGTGPTVTAAPDRPRKARA